MIQLIDKNTVKDELKRLMFVCDSVICDKNIRHKKRYIERRVAYEHFLKFINSLEVENVDLEAEFFNFIKDRHDIGPDVGQLNDVVAIEIAKHFFRLGLKAGERK